MNKLILSISIANISQTSFGIDSLYKDWREEWEVGGVVVGYYCNNAA